MSPSPPTRPLAPLTPNRMHWLDVMRYHAILIQILKRLSNLHAISEFPTPGPLVDGDISFTIDMADEIRDIQDALMSLMLKISAGAEPSLQFSPRGITVAAINEFLDFDNGANVDGSSDSFYTADEDGDGDGPTEELRRARVHAMLDFERLDMNTQSG